MEIEDDVLIADIETQTFGRPDPEKDRLKLFGCYSYKTNKYYVYDEKEDIIKAIKAHKIMVGFNYENYDKVVLEREGISHEYKIIVDLFDIFKKRAASIKIKAGMLKDLLMSYSLDYITKTLGIVDEETGKGKIDHTLFSKEKWSFEEKKMMYDYLRRDIEVTKKLYEWVEEYFAPFKEFVPQKDIDNKNYIRTTIPKFAYKAICLALGWPEEYNQGEDMLDEDSISGGYVSYPAGEKFEGDVYCLDVNSLYPHVIMQCNLFGRTVNEGWHGGNKWKCEGYYNNKELSPLCKLFQKWYADRVAYKKSGDRREFSVKLLLNSVYGIMSMYYYKRIYDKVAGGDCTRLGRQWIKYIRRRFVDFGYTVAYSDTDSVYLVDPFHNKQQMLDYKTLIIEEIKMTVPFPQTTFNMGVDAEIKYLYFYKGENTKTDDEEMDEFDIVNKPLGYMKKNYIYLTKDDKLIIKNLGIRKKSNSELSRKIFWEKLVPEFKQGYGKITKTAIKNYMMEYLSEDYTLAKKRFDVRSVAEYEKSSGSIYAQVAQRYGENDIHFLIPNTRHLGVGKGVKYCSIEEFEKSKLRYTDIDMDSLYSELEYFVDLPKVKTLIDY